VARHLPGSYCAFPLALETAIEHRFDIDDWRFVDRFDGVDAKARRRFRLDDRHAMNADRVRPIRRPRAEHAATWLSQIVARMDVERTAVRSIQPREHEGFVSDAEIAKCGHHFRQKYEPGRWCTFVSLFGCHRRIAQRRFDASDRTKHEHA